MDAHDESLPMETPVENFNTTVVISLDDSRMSGSGDLDSDYTAPIVSDEVTFYFRLCVYNTICLGVCVFGCITNTINMVVFVKTGFKDTININLFALAISDFGVCFTLIFSTIAMNPYVHKLDVPVSWDELQYTISAWPHVGFTKITTLITTFITFERCLCVSMPLKVKTIITRNVVIGSMVSCYLVIIVLMIPLLYANGLGEKFYPSLNKTLVGLVFTPNREQVEAVILPIMNVALSFGTFALIVTFTAVLVIQLKKKTKWRRQATSATKTKDTEDSTDTRENRISKMVVSLSALFIACLFPSVAAMQFLTWAEPEIHTAGAYANLNFVVAFLPLTIESVNSSINIIIYYRNSTKYKTVFDQIFFSKKGHNKAS